MARVTTAEAIKLSGRSRSAFFLDVKAGRVSKIREGNRTYYETSELLRAYGTLHAESSDEVQAGSKLNEVELQARDTEIRMLRELLEEKDRRLVAQESIIESYKGLQRLLEYDPSSTRDSVQKETKPGFLRRLFGGK